MSLTQSAQTQRISDWQPVINPSDTPAVSKTLTFQSQGKKTYRKGDVIFHEGQRPNALYYLVEGKVKLFKTGYEGRDQIVRLARPGDIIGYLEVIGDELHATTARPLEDSIVSVISKESFFSRLREHPEFAMYLMRMLGRELWSIEKQMMSMAQKPVRERLAETLLILRDTYGIDPDKVLDISLTREDLASIVGTAPETVIRLLADFRKDGLIHTSGKKIQLLDERRLKKEAGLSG